MKALGLLVAGACTAAAPQHIVDSSGAPFALEPDGTIDVVDGTPKAAPCRSGRPIYAWSLGRFITISSACAYSDGTWGTIDNLERPVACTTTDDCPQWQAWSFECRGGLCQNADTGRYPPLFVNWDMTDELCFAPVSRLDTIDRFSPATLQVSQATTAACPDQSRACTLPLPSLCWQP